MQNELERQQEGIFLNKSLDSEVVVENIKEIEPKLNKISADLASLKNEFQVLIKKLEDDYAKLEGLEDGFSEENLDLLSNLGGEINVLEHKTAEIKAQIMELENSRSILVEILKNFHRVLERQGIN